MGWGKKIFVGMAVGGATVGLVVGVVGWRASRALRLSGEELRAERELRLLARPLAAPQNAGFEAVSSPASFVQAARFQAHLYIASSAGLLEYDSGGAPLRQFLVGRDLPSSPLVALATAILADSNEPEL